MKKCIIFDVDRTIVDSYIPELLSLQEAIENVTNRKITETTIKKLTSLPTSEFFDFLNLSDEEIKIINIEWEKTFNKYKTICFPKIKEIINELYKKGYVIGIITSRTSDEFYELNNELADILSCFKVIITSDLIKNPKPHKDSVDYLCNKLQLIPEELIYIGDSEIDKIFSQNCNIDFIPACWENKELENEEKACVTPEEIIKRIKEFNIPNINHLKK